MEIAARLGTCRIGRPLVGRIGAVVLCVVDVVDPLPGIARHVQHAKGTGPRRKGADRCEGLEGVTAAGSTRVGLGTIPLVPPGIGTAVGPTRGVFPLGFAGQVHLSRPAACPIAIVPGLRPGDIDHGQAALVVIGQVGRRCTTPLLRAQTIHGVGDLGLVDPKGIQGHSMDEMGVAVGAAHLEAPAWDVDHLHLVGRTQFEGPRLGRGNGRLGQRGCRKSDGRGRRRGGCRRREQGTAHRQGQRQEHKKGDRLSFHPPIV